MEKSTKFTETPDAIQDVEAASIEEKGELLSTGFNGRISKILLSVETRGIQRVTDEERQKNPTKVWNACTFW